MGLLDQFIVGQHFLSGHCFITVPLSSLNLLPPDGGGVYVFAAHSEGMLGPSCRPCYVGQSKCFNDRIGGHHDQMTPALRMGATHLHLHPCAPLYRDFLERKLVAELDPPLNKQLRRPGLLDGLSLAR